VRTLASAPIWLLLAGWLALCGLVAAGARVGLLQAVPEDERPSVGPVAAPLMPALGAVFALLTALSLASEAGQLRAAEDQVSTEAAAASRLAWAATSPGIASEPVHAALVSYLETTRTEEWRGESERGDPATLSALATLERRVRIDAATDGVGTPQASDLLGSLAAVTSARRQRLATASHGLPTLYVAVVAISGLALIVNSSAVALTGRRRVALLPLGLVGVVGLALALLFAISAPFLGGFVASGGPIDSVVSDIHDGVFHP
jgi:hypothetical protein